MTRAIETFEFHQRAPAAGIFGRLDRHVIPEPNSGCLLWLGGLTHDGYGKFSCVIDGVRVWRAHRAAYLLDGRSIPLGTELDHKCRVRCCINPNHLEPVPPVTNKLRGNGFGGRNARKTSCTRGHQLAGENLYVLPNGSRSCRTCTRVLRAARRARRA